MVPPETAFQLIILNDETRVRIASSSRRHAPTICFQIALTILIILHKSSVTQYFLDGRYNEMNIMNLFELYKIFSNNIGTLVRCPIHASLSFVINNFVPYSYFHFADIFLISCARHD